MKEGIRNRLNLDKIMYYDDAISVTGEMPRPVIGTEKIFKNALAADYMFKFAEPDYPTVMETHE